MYYQEQDEKPSYAISSVTSEWRRVDPPIMINGEETYRYQSPCVTEFVDLDTGEIISEKEMRKRPESWPVVYLSENFLRRQAVLNRLREEVRELALFILSFRNSRRGITPSVDTVIGWYARLNGKRPSNVRRNVKTLEEAGILAGSSLVSPLFQFSGKRIKANEHLGEDAAASLKYLEMWIRNRCKDHRPRSNNPNQSTQAASAAFFTSETIINEHHV